MKDDGSIAPKSTRLSRWLASFIPDQPQARLIMILTLVQALGMGVFLACSAIFFTRVVGLPPERVGEGLSAAGAAGLVGVVPAGRLADRFGAARPLAGVYIALAVLFPLYAFVDDFLGFLVVACLIGLFQTAGSPLRSALALSLFGPKAQMVRAQMRSAFNLGFGVGAALAGIAIASGTHGAFIAVLVADGASQAVCAVMAYGFHRKLRRAHTAQRIGGPASQGEVVRMVGDRRRMMPGFVAVSLVCGSLELYQPILEVAVPLWIINHTAAPASLNALLVVVATACIVLLQTTMNRSADTALAGARLQVRAGLLLAAACLVFAASHWGSAVVAALILVVGVLLLSLGELAQSAGAYAISFQLPPPGQEGAYQGVFALGRGLQQTVGPVLVTGLAVGLGQVGWVVLAALFVFLGVLCRPLVAHVERARNSEPVDVEEGDVIAVSGRRVASSPGGESQAQPRTGTERSLHSSNHGWLVMDIVLTDVIGEVALVLIAQAPPPRRVRAVRRPAVRREGR